MLAVTVRQFKCELSILTHSKQLAMYLYFDISIMIRMNIITEYEYEQWSVDVKIDNSLLFFVIQCYVIKY